MHSCTVYNVFTLHTLYIYYLLELCNTNLVCLFNIVFPKSKLITIFFPPNHWFFLAYVIRFSTSSASLKNKIKVIQLYIEIYCCILKLHKTTK